MGGQLYTPTLDRFLTTEPVTGESANNYDYCSADLVNDVDLAGTWSWRKAFKVAAVVGGIVGAVACGAPIICGFVGGAIAGAAAYSVQNAGTDNFNWGALAGSTAVGAAGGAGYRGTGRILGHAGKTTRYIGVTFNKEASARGSDLYIWVYAAVDSIATGLAVNPVGNSGTTTSEGLVALGVIAVHGDVDDARRPREWGTPPPNIPVRRRRLAICIRIGRSCPRRSRMGFR